MIMAKEAYHRIRNSSMPKNIIHHDDSTNPDLRQKKKTAKANLITKEKRLSIMIYGLTSWRSSSK